MSNRLAQLLDFLAKDPKDPFIYYGLALEYRSMGNRQEALAYFNTLIGDFPDYIPTYLMLAQLLQEMNQKEEAIATLERGIVQGKAAKESHAVSEMNELLDELRDEG